MSFNPLAAWTVSKATCHLSAGATAIELGNQRLNVDDAMLDRIIRAAEAGELPYANPDGLRELRALRHVDRKPYTARFFAALGFASYDSIDLTEYFGALLMDLNVVIRQHYGYDRQFNLVTNNGTGEHIFNQLAVFTNVHDLTAPGGIMIHILPYRGWTNHGFYNFNPIIFADIARANGYEMVRISISDRFANEREVHPPDCFSIRFERTGRARSVFDAAMSAVDALRGRRFIGNFVVSVLRKTNDAPFRVPIQGKYVDEIPEHRRVL
jgi:hypothetical protein